MRRVLLALVLALSGVVLTQLPAQACSCVAGQTLSAQAKRATDVLIGTVVSTSPGQAATTTGYDVQVERTYKGGAEAGVTLRTPADSAACGLELDADRRYLIMGTRQGGAIEVNACGGSRPARTGVVRQVTQLLGPGSVPQAVPDEEPAQASYTDVEVDRPAGFARLAAPGAAVAIVGLLGLLLLRRVGRPR